MNEHHKKIIEDIEARGLIIGAIVAYGAKGHQLIGYDTLGFISFVSSPTKQILRLYKEVPTGGMQAVADISPRVKK